MPDIIILFIMAFIGSLIYFFVGISRIYKDEKEFNEQLKNGTAKNPIPKVDLSR